MLSSLDAIAQIFLEKGSAAYDGESVSQLEHALQCATLAQTAGASPTTIAACLLHDVGHLICEPVEPKCDRHEDLSAIALRRLFGDAVTEPIRLHVRAKRYLCTVENSYWEHLSPSSRQSLEFQGGMLTPAEVEQFLQEPFASVAIQLRRWDDLAKVVGQTTPPFHDFLPVLTACLQ